MAHRIKALLAFFACAVVAAMAQENAASTAASGENKIEDAKREFQALKASRATTDQAPTLALPKVELPSLPTGASAPTGISKNGKKEKSAQQKSKNWLLDAMEQGEQTSRSPQSRKRGDATATDRTETGLPDELVASDELDPLNPTRELRDRPNPNKTERADKAPAVLDNPLAPFMSGWISQRDHDVLLPKTSATPMLDASLAQFVDAPGGTTAMPNIGPGGMSTAATLPGLPPLTRGGSEAIENPYLRADAPLPMPAATLPAPNPTPAMIVPPDHKVPTLEAPAPAKSPAPPVDLSKPPADAKYFPQLKRF